MSDDKATPRFYGEFIGPDWFEIPGRPDARFLAPPPLTPAQLAEAETGSWEGWEEIGLTSDIPPAFGGPDPIRLSGGHIWIKVDGAWVVR